MRITVGGFLLVSGAAALVVVGPLRLLDMSTVTNQIGGLKKSVDWAMDYFKVGEPESKPEKPAPEPIAETPAPNPVVSVNVAAPAAPVVQPEAAPIVAVTPTAPIKKKRTRHRRIKKSTVKGTSNGAAVTPIKKSVPTAKAAAAQTDQLIGTYVSLKLKSGRDVKGILQARTAKEYTVELPGMGPFQYPAENVVSVGLAQ